MQTKIDQVLEGFTLTRSGFFRKRLSAWNMDDTTLKGCVFMSLGLSLITWVPLFVLSALQGLAFAGKVSVPFVLDFTTHVRFLVVMPILVFAQYHLNIRLRELSAQFFKSGILGESDLPAFEQTRASVSRLSGSVWADLGILVLVLISVVYRSMPENTGADRWSFVSAGEGAAYSWAGAYFVFFCMSLFQFIVFRWLWRWLIWFFYFYKLSKMPLKLNPAHPDLAGGIGFLGFPPSPFLMATMASSVLIATIIAERIVFEQKTLADFYAIMGGFIVFSIVMNVLPLLVFVGQLAQKRRKGFFEYSALVQEHHRQFDKKWLSEPHESPPPGFGDASSLTDFNTSFDTVKSMRVIPFDLKIMFSSIVIAALPMLPLFLFEYNLLDLLKKILGMLL